MIFVDTYRKWARQLSEGPDWIRIPDLLVTHNYRSPTVLLVAWLYGWYIRLFTLPGRMIVVISPLIIGYTLLSVRTPIRILAFSVIAIFLVDFFFGMLFRPKLRVVREVPERVRAGSDVRLEYELTNRRRWSALDLEIDRYVFDKGLYPIRGAVEVPIMAGREKRRVSGLVRAGRRGVYLLPRPIVDSRFPLALFKWSCRDGRQHKLHVYPAFTSLLTLELPVGKKFQKEGVSKVSKVGESMDFAGCRDFRSGDEPRHIHWRSTARAGRLVVREYQEEYLSRVAVIVDTFVPPRRFSFRLRRPGRQEFRELEGAVALTAALADYLARGDYVIDFFAAGPEIFHFQGGRSLNCLDSILDILACIEPNTDRPIFALTPLVMEEVAGVGSAVVILLGWNEERRLFLEELRRNGVAVKAVLVGDAAAFPGLPDEIKAIDPDDIIGGRINRL